MCSGGTYSLSLEVSLYRSYCSSALSSTVSHGQAPGVWIGPASVKMPMQKQRRWGGWSMGSIVKWVLWGEIRVPSCGDTRNCITSFLPQSSSLTICSPLPRHRQARSGGTFYF